MRSRASYRHAALSVGSLSLTVEVVALLLFAGLSAGSVAAGGHAGILRVIPDERTFGMPSPGPVLRVTLTHPDPSSALPRSGTAYWSNITGLGAGAPDQTLGGAIAFDPSLNTTVFLSYDTAITSGFSWEYGNYTWGSGAAGVPQIYPALAYDGSDQVLVAFGGSAPIPHELGTTIPTSATWGFSGAGWANLTGSLATLPPPTALPLMAADPADHGALLLDPVGPSNSSQTWLFSNGSWTNLSATAGKPPPGPSGADSVMTYDPALGGVVFFGGSFPGTSFAVATNETWEFAAGKWTDLNVTGPDFATGSVQTMAFDNASGQLVDLVAPAYLYSANGTPSYQDWVFGGGHWANATSGLPATPPVGYDPLSVWDAADQYLLYMSGGYDAQSWALGSTPLHVAVMVAPSPIDVGNVTDIVALVTGGAPPIRFSYPLLPTGCAGSDVPRLTCRPSVAGNFTVRVTVEDSTNATANASSSLVVGPALGASGPLVAPSSGYFGAVANFSVHVSGGLPPYSYGWSVPIPGCVVPDAASFSCALDELGTIPLSVAVTDQTLQAVIVVVGNVSVVNRPVVTSFTAAPAGVETGEPLQLNATVSGGAYPLEFSYSGLPAGCMSIDGPTVTCRPGASGLFNVTVAVVDGLGTVARGSVGITVLAALVVTGVQLAPDPATVGATVSFGYTAEGGAGSNFAQWSGLPMGCTPTQGNFTCVMQSNGTYEVGVSVRDALGVVARANASLVVQSGNLTGGGTSVWSAISPWAWATVGVIGLGLVGFLIWDRRQRSPPRSEAFAVPSESTSTPDGSRGSSVGTDAPTSSLEAES